MHSVFEKHDLLDGFPALLPRHTRFPQEQNLWCGPAALQSVLANHGTETTQEMIAEIGNMTPQGMTLAGLKHAAERFGFNAYGKTYDHLAQLRKDLDARRTPILQFALGPDVSHYGVACGYIDDRFIVHDPSYEQHIGGVVPWKTFAKQFFRKWPNGTIAGYGLIVTREPPRLDSAFITDILAQK